MHVASSRFYLCKITVSRIIRIIWKKHLTNTYSCYNMLIAKPTYHVGKVVKETKGIAYEH